MKRDGPYWQDRMRREFHAGDMLIAKVCILGYLMCVAANVGHLLKPVSFDNLRPDSKPE